MKITYVTVELSEKAKQHLEYAIKVLEKTVIFIIPQIALNQAFFSNLITTQFHLSAELSIAIISMIVYFYQQIKNGEAVITPEAIKNVEKVVEEAKLAPTT